MTGQHQFFIPALPARSASPTRATFQEVNVELSNRLQQQPAVQPVIQSQSADWGIPIVGTALLLPWALLPTKYAVLATVGVLSAVYYSLLPEESQDKKVTRSPR